mgnify:CR=1 FL=1
MTIGIIKEITVTFLNPIRDRTEIMNPRNMAPVSPINILAGKKLYFKNPNVLPANTRAISATNISPILKTAIPAMVSSAIVETPPANPSNPSIKFMAFVIPTIQSTVNGIAKYPKCICSPNGVLIKFNWILPPITMMRAATIWPINFAFGFNSYISSKIPRMIMTVAPSSIAENVLELAKPGVKIGMVIKKLKKIASPPMLGMILECTFLWLGLSVAPILNASFITNGVMSMVKHMATKKAAINNKISTLYLYTSEYYLPRTFNVKTRKGIV